MAAIRKSGLTKEIYFPKAASTAFTLNCFVKFDASGHVIPSVSTDATILGVCLKTIASTDSDYASNTLIPIEVPVEKAVEWIVPVETGTATAALVGTQCDLNDSLGVNVNGTSHNPVYITQFISATSVAVVFAAVLA